jgi:hypothetical protein
MPRIDRAALLEEREHIGEDRFYVPDNRDIDPFVLADLRRVYIDVHEFCVGRKGIDLPGYPVIEPCPDREHEVALGDCEVRVLGPVHPEHPEVEGMVAGDTAQPHQGGRDRDLADLGDLHDLVRGIGRDYPTARINERTLCKEHHLDRFFDLLFVAFYRWLVPRRFIFSGPR